MNVCKSQQGAITTDQENKINELVKNFNYEDAKSCDTPTVLGYLIFNNEGNLLDNNTF